VVSIAAASIIAKVTRDPPDVALWRRIAPAMVSSPTRVTACRSISRRSIGSDRRCITARFFAPVVTARERHQATDIKGGPLVIETQLSVEIAAPG